MITEPTVINFPKIGNPGLGYISLAENQTLPFSVNRIYWTYYTPEQVLRGSHAHHNLEQILIALSGTIVVNTEMPNGEKHTFILDSPDRGVYVPKYTWHVMRYSHNAVQMSIASMVYEEQDYIRDYNDFLAINNKLIK